MAVGESSVGMVTTGFSLTVPEVHLSTPVTAMTPLIRGFKISTSIRFLVDVEKIRSRCVRPSELSLVRNRRVVCLKATGLLQKRHVLPESCARTSQIGYLQPLLVTCR